MKNRNKGKKHIGGFTLIELLVVIAIIAILSTVVMAGLNSARQKGRDAKRLSDIKQVQAALELFFDTCGGYPPNTVGPILSGSTDTALGLDGGENDGGLACPGTITMGTYMSDLPVNPSPGGETYQYCGSSANAVPSANNPPTACGTAGSVSYLIGLNLEGSAGSLLLGDHNAAPSGII
jgi:prepilin-type N-terminal cleavage/methylation domain-containing protein